MTQTPLTPPGCLASPWSALTSSRSYAIAALRAAAISVFLLGVLIAVIVF